MIKNWDRITAAPHGSLFWALSEVWNDDKEDYVQSWEPVRVVRGYYGDPDSVGVLIIGYEVPQEVGTHNVQEIGEPITRPVEANAGGD